MQYALLAFGSQRSDDGPIEDAIAEVLAKPGVTGWIRLYGDGSATTVRTDAKRLLMTDGPFVESKEAIAGVFVIEARDLDHAIALARLTPIMDGGVEVRPLLGFEVVD